MLVAGFSHLYPIFTKVFVFLSNQNQRFVENYYSAVYVGESAVRRKCLILLDPYRFLPPKYQLIFLVCQCYFFTGTMWNLKRGVKQRRGPDRILFANLVSSRPDRTIPITRLVPHTLSPLYRHKQSTVYSTIKWFHSPLALWRVCCSSRASKQRSYSIIPFK